MGITLADNRADLCAGPPAPGPLSIEDRGIVHGGEPAWSSRVGIRVGTERLWRCYLSGCPAVSGPRR